MVDTRVRTYDPSTVGRVVHGVGAYEAIADLLDELGSRRVIVASSRSVIERTDLIPRLRDIIGDRLCAVSRPIGPHTPAADVTALEAVATEQHADTLLALGGSSVSDGAKIAALRLGGATPRTVVTDGVTEIAQTGQVEKPIPLIAVPTTLSVGEFTHGAGMVREGCGGKIMTMDDRMPPWAVVLDPEVTLPTPRNLWLSTGVKAVDHAAETIWGSHAHPVGDALSAAALSRLTDSLSRTAEDPADLEARLESQLAAWMSVTSMKNTSLHLSHILEHCMGTYWHLDHGTTSCVALPTVMSYLAEEAPSKVAAVARGLGVPDSPGQDASTAGKRGSARLAEWIEGLGLPHRLRDVVPDKSGFGAVAEQTVLALSFFGYVPEGRERTITELLSSMW
jgi:maleylacetate reductase